VELSRLCILNDQDAQTLAASGTVVSKSSVGSPGGPSMEVEIWVPIGARTGVSRSWGTPLFASVGAS
jgi:hypothetical protein